MAEALRGARLSLGSPNTAKAWPGLQGLALRSQILEDEPLLAAPVTRKLLRLILMMEAQEFSPAEGWFALERLTLAIQACEGFALQQNRIPPDRAGELLVTLLSWDEQRSTAWRKSFAHRPDLN